MNHPDRSELPEWPRLMSEAQATAYLSIGRTMLAERGPKPRRVGRRKVWDRHDLDRWADRLGGQPLDPAQVIDERKERERRFRERMTTTEL